jgi:hypothetical protein
MFSSTLLDLRNLQTPLSIYTPVASRTDPLDLYCRFWNTSIKAWDSRGLIGIGLSNMDDKEFVLCETTHLTDFATVVSAAAPTINLVDPIGDASLLLNYNPENMLTPIILSSILLGYLFLLIVFICSDMRKKKALQKLKEEIFITKGKFNDPPESEKLPPKQDTFFLRYINVLRNEHDW